MAKKQAKQAIEVPATSIDDDGDDELSAEEQDVFAALSEMEGAADAKWTVFRVAPSNKPIGYCDTLSSSELTLDELRRRFGAGKYRVRGMRSTGGYLAHRTITIATDAPKEIAAPALSSESSLIEKFLADQNERAEKRRELLLIALPAAITALPAIIQAFGPRRDSNPVELLAGLKSLMPDPKPAPDMTETFLKIMEFARNSMGDKSDDSWLGLAKDAANNLIPLLTGKLSGEPAPAVAPARIASPAQVTQTIEPEPQNVSMLKLVPWARETLAYLVKKAAASADSSLYADFVLDNVPPGVDVTTFAQYLNHPDWWMYLQQFQPSVAPYQGWFAQFRDDLIASYEEQYGALASVPNAPPKKSNATGVESTDEAS